jgi:hypothetical protein
MSFNGINVLVDACRKVEKKNNERQESIAFEWNELSNEEYKDTTVVSRLSELLKGKDKGVRFFFGGQEERYLTLFQVLDIPVEKHEEILKELRDKRQIIIDACCWSEQGHGYARLFSSIRNIINSQQQARIELILTNNQFNSLPFPYSKMPNVEVYEIATLEDGAAKINKILRTNGILISPRKVIGFEHWCVANFDGEKIQFGNWNQEKDWVVNDQMPDRKRFATPLKVSHSLRALGLSTNTVAVLPDCPFERYQLAFNLADEKKAAELGSVDKRFSMANQLDVEASSTEQERIAHEIQRVTNAIGEVPQQSTQENLKDLLARAKRRSTHACLIIRDEIHLRSNRVYPKVIDCTSIKWNAKNQLSPYCGIK